VKSRRGPGEYGTNRVPAWWFPRCLRGHCRKQSDLAPLQIYPRQLEPHLPQDNYDSDISECEAREEKRRELGLVSRKRLLKVGGTIERGCRNLQHHAGNMNSAWPGSKTVALFTRDSGRVMIAGSGEIPGCFAPSRQFIGRPSDGQFSPPAIRARATAHESDELSESGRPKQNCRRAEGPKSISVSVRPFRKTG